MADGSFQAMGAADDQHRATFGAGPNQEWPRGLTKRAADLRGQIKPLDKIAPVLKSRYLVKGWIDLGTLSVVYGEPGAGKTFFALDLAMHIAAGLTWHGCRVQDGDRYAGPVAYIAGEGGRGIHNRLEAIRLENPDLWDRAIANQGFNLVPTMLDLTASRDPVDLVEALQHVKPAFIVIDTLAMAFGAGDENTAQHMGVFVQSCRSIREAFGAHLLVVHHSGKDSSRGARGSGALRGAADTEIELTRDDETIIATQRKQRDLAIGSPFAYRLKGVCIGKDEDDDAVTSCIVEPTEAPKKQPAALSGQALIAMQALDDALKEHGAIKSGEDYPANRACVSLDHWRAHCDRHSLSSGEGESSHRTAFHKARGRLQEKGQIRVLNGFVWRCEL